MRIVNIFVASSIISFSKERKRIAAYFCELNNRLIESRIFFNVKFCEELDNAVPEIRKQDEYNALIANSDLVLFLVDSDCGDYTFEEFKTALLSEKHPKIVIFSRSALDELSGKLLFMRKQAVDGAAEFISFDVYHQIEERIAELTNSMIEEMPLSRVQQGEKKLRKITFFLGASRNEKEDERNEILRFVLALNEKLLSKQIYVLIAPCTETANSRLLPEIQGDHEDLIGNSDAAFFVFFSKVDKITEADLLFAATRFRECGTPKIYTYFSDQRKDEDSVLRVKQYIDQTLNHYYSIFTSVDSIKLSILLHLSVQNIYTLSIENSTIVSQKEALLEVNELSVFSKNKKLKQLKRRLTELTTQYNEAADAFDRNHNSRDLLKRLSDLDDAICEMRERIRQEENESLSMLYAMHRNVAKGEMNELMKKAYRLLEKGMVEEAAEILNKETVDVYYGNSLTDEVKALRAKTDDAIEMYRHVIHIQKMLDESETTVNTIISCYETILGLIQVSSPDMYTVVLEYAQYLDQQDSLRAEQIFLRAEYLFSNPDQKVSLDMLAQLYSAMGSFYLKQYDHELSEKYLEKYYQIAQSLYGQNEEEYALLYVQACLWYSQIGILGKVEVVEQGLHAMKKLFDAASHNAYVNNMANYYYQRGLLYGGIFDHYSKLASDGMTVELLEEKRSEDKDRNSIVPETGEKAVALLEGYNTQNSLLVNDYFNIAIDSFYNAAALLEMHDVRSGLLADVYNGIAELTRNNDRSKSSEKIVRRYYDKAQEILEELYAVDPDTYADALGTVYNNKCMCYSYYGEKYYQGLQCLKVCESVYLYWYQKNPRKNGQGLAECYVQMSYIYDSLGNKKRAIYYAQKGTELFEGLTEVNYDRYAIKLAWAYSELGLLYNLYEQDDLTRDYLCKSLDILEKSDSIHIQQSQHEIILKIQVAILLMIKREKEILHEATYDLADRVFRFMYAYVKPSFCGEPALISSLYSLGEGLLYHFDSLDHEKTMQFYYPAVMELGEQRLLDSSISEDDRFRINMTLSLIVGLSGNVEKGHSYLQASLDSFQKTDQYLKSQNKSNRKSTKKKRKKK